MSICEAIEERKLVNFNYKGHNRTLIPAAHGHHRSTGNRVLRAYQVGGSRNTGETPGWGMFAINEITNFSVLDDVFEEVPAGYRRGDSHIDPIHCEL